mmetsp:Transcript_15690/g.37469  ORF Transcript_15690/g.37469 Transcript_15690/m.37469 type:complete len:282 (-) Transcript_15690:342-1187(-)
MGDEAELDDADLNDVGVSAGALPSFSSGGGLPSFSSSNFKPRTSSLPESPGGVGEGGGATGKSPVEHSKKKKRDDSELDVDSPAPDSSASGTPAKQPKKKKSKSAAEKKQSEKDGAAAAVKSPSKGKDASGDKDKEVEEEKKEGEGAEAKKEDDGDQPSDAEAEEELDEDEDEKYKDAHRKLEQELIGTCTEEEWTRYEAMRQSKFSMGAIKNLLSQYSDIPVGQIPQPLAFTIAGVAKVLVGELIDNARLVRQERGDRETEPLQPRCVLLACRAWELGLL